jgi:hypothetical protein
MTSRLDSGLGNDAAAFGGSPAFSREKILSNNKRFSAGGAAVQFPMTTLILNCSGLALAIFF